MELVTKDNNCSKAIFLRELPKMRSEGLLVDVTLCAEGKEIPCHRLVLACNSEYFRVMFNGSHSESKKDKIEIRGVSAKVLQLLVDYAYAFEVDITDEDVRPLFEAAVMLQFHGAARRCEHVLQGFLNKETCLEIWAMADRVSSTRLAETAKSYALKRFEEVCKTENFLQLPFYLLKKYISDEGLQVKKEERILEAVVLWTKHNLNEREKHLEELLQCDCFSRIYQDYLKTLLKTNKVLTLESIRRFLNNQPTHETVRHILQQDILVLGGARLYHDGVTGRPMLHLNNNNMYRLGLDSQCIDTSPLPESLRDCRGFAACVVDGDVIVTGGLPTLTQAWRYRPRPSPIINPWTELGCLKTGRFNHGMAVLHGQVYAVGGCTPVQSANVRYDIEVCCRTSRCTTVQQTAGGRLHHCRLQCAFLV
ncbi:kelch-like protein 24 [Branchiostoma floridae x Branchiostoma japonicum]